MKLKLFVRAVNHFHRIAGIYAFTGTECTE